MEQTYYRGRKEYGGIRVEQASKLKELEKENARLKKLVADLSLDNSILKEAVRTMGISERHLRLLLETGQVEGKKLGHDWVVLSLDYKRKRKSKGG